MNRKIPPDAFSLYFSLGPERSYQAVAEKYGVSKRAVSKLAAREGWQQKLRELEQKAREKAEEKALETLEDMSARHLKVLRFIQGKAIEALRSMPIDSAAAAVRAYHASLDKERLIRGEPLDRTEMSVEEVTREEMRKWLVWEKPKEEKRGDASAAASA